MIPKIYPASEHKISIQSIDTHAIYVLEKLRAAGFVAYLVGGSVRDLLLGCKPKDFDISTSAKPEEVRKVFSNSILIGRRFRLAHIRFGRKIIEVSTFRSGDTESDALIVRDNEWGSPEEDVTRRDFTINGLFYDSENETIIDYVQGYPDIQKKCLRTIGHPYTRFKQDPVRMIRLLKFRARFGLEIDQEAKLALLECRGEIIKSSQARIFEELLRMLESGASDPFFRLMTEHGVLQLLFPALAEFLETADGQEIFSYLSSIDLHIKEKASPLLDRATLLSALLFSFAQKHIDLHFTQREKVPHLGEIQEENRHVIDEAFRPFFVLPRRIRLAILSILTSQFRLTPLEKKSQTRLRIPNDPDFPLALQFLHVRSLLEPGLKKVLEEWSALTGDLERPIAAPRRRRPRRRRGHGT